jgi:hypothetical protein
MASIIGYSDGSESSESHQRHVERPDKTARLSLQQQEQDHRPSIRHAVSCYQQNRDVSLVHPAGFNWIYSVSAYLAA